MNEEGAAKGVMRWLAAIATFAALVLAWEILVPWLGLPELVAPRPSAIGQELVAGIANGQLFRHLLVTAGEMLGGFLLAAIVGIGVASLVERSRFLRFIVQPYIVILQSTPKVALAPFIVLWFGFGIESKILIAALVAFFPIFVNSLTGLMSTSPKMIELMQVLDASASQQLIKVKIPQALPFIFAGLEVGILMSLTGAVVGEFVSSNAGLGYLIATSNAQLQIPAAFAALVPLIMLGSLSYALVSFLKSRMAGWAGRV